MKTGTDTKSRSKKKGSREKETARSLALSALLKIEDGVYTKDAMQEVLSKEQLTGADRGLFVMLCEGVTARRITLDAAIDLVAKTKTAKMKPVIRNILWMGAFQLLFLDRIPDAAVVDESVKLCIRRGFAPLKGFVNGVLRELIRRRDAGTWFPEGGEDAAALSIRYSMPEFLVKKWIAWYGKDACAQIFESFLNGAPTSLWLNTREYAEEEIVKTLADEGIMLTKDKELPQAFFAKGLHNPENSPAFAKGMYYLQDVSSMRETYRCSTYARRPAARACFWPISCPGPRSRRGIFRRRR